MAGPGGALILSEGTPPAAPSEGRLAVFADNGALYTVDSSEVVKPVADSFYLLKFSGLCDGNTAQTFTLADTGRGDASPLVNSPGYLLLGQGTLVEVGVHAFENTLLDDAGVGVYLGGNLESTLTVMASAPGVSSVAASTSFVGGLLDVRVSLAPGETGQLLLYVTLKISTTGGPQ